MSDCILSELKPNGSGYPLASAGFRDGGSRRRIPHHRLAYAQHHGLDPDGPEMTGMHVCHRCDNPPCINVDHLFLGTRFDNMNDMAMKGRHGGAKLTEYTVRWIRSYHQMGAYRQVELAEMFGVTRANISSIVRRRTWRHI